MKLFNSNIVPYTSTEGCKIYPIVVDIKKGIKSGETISFVTSDNKVGIISVELIDNNSPYVIEGNLVTATIHRPDDSVLEMICENIEGNVVTIELGVNGTFIDGVHTFDIKIHRGDDKIVGIPTMSYVVHKSLSSDGCIEEEDKLPIISNLTNEVIRLNGEWDAFTDKFGDIDWEEMQSMGANSVTVNGTKYTQVDGNIALPSYPTLSSLGAEPKNSNIQAHISSTHAPSNAQKNSDITKAEIEAKLIGNITTHTHNQYLTQHQDLSHLALKTELHNHSNKYVLDNITSAKVTEWNSKSTFSGSYNDLSNKPTIPTKTSELTNDSKFITTIPSEYVTETELNAKGYATVNQVNNKADKVNGVFYIEGDSTTAGVWTGHHEDITEYYSGLMINYKINVAGVSGGSTLNINNLGAVQVVRNVSTAVSTTYAVGCIINLTYTVDNGTAYWKVADYDVNTKNTTGTSNKIGSKMFIVGATSQTSSGTTTYSNTNCYIGTDNKLYSGGNKVVDTKELEAKGYLTEHQDISGKADKTELNSLTLGVHTDGMIYLFKNGQPIGNGVTQSTQSGDVVGYVDSENNIVLSGKLADGTYNLKYEMEDGSKIYVGQIDLSDKPDYTNQIPLSINSDGTPFNGGQGWKTGYRISKSSGSESAMADYECTGFIPVANNSKIRIKGIGLPTSADDGNFVVAGYDKRFTKLNTGNGVTLGAMVESTDGNGVSTLKGFSNFTHFATTELAYIRFSSSHIDENSILTVDEPIV